MLKADTNKYGQREESHVVAANELACRGDDAHRNHQFAVASEFYKKVNNMFLFYWPAVLPALLFDIEC